MPLRVKGVLHRISVRIHISVTQCREGAKLTRTMAKSSSGPSGSLSFRLTISSRKN